MRDTQQTEVRQRYRFKSVINSLRDRNDSVVIPKRFRNDSETIQV